MGQAADILRERTGLPGGYTPRVLSCAWCPGGDRLDLGEFRMSWLAPVNRYTGKRDRITETLPEPPPRAIVEWLDRHEECADRARGAIVRTVGG